ncbi:hypothetical protein T03_17091 [Trichinella britovi]|uniref:Uncharacterized protein n=1 Tax=Trichinella britovi TaxID=45882 RepID=A0A0V1C6M1_TRIBR|nr:hypothetical protein T03_17091 [Trichinella britovi]
MTVIAVRLERRTTPPPKEPLVTLGACAGNHTDQMHYSLPPSFDVGDVEVDDENICTFDVLGIAARYPELGRFHSVYASSNNDNVRLTFLLLQNGHQRTLGGRCDTKESIGGR